MNALYIGLWSDWIINLTACIWTAMVTAPPGINIIAGIRKDWLMPSAV